MVRIQNNKKIVLEDSILWVVNAQNIIISNKKTKEQYILNYPEAAIWDLISRNSDVDLILEKMRVITNRKGLKKVEEVTRKTIHDWLKKNLIKEI
jgi:hypothetical protein